MIKSFIYTNIGVASVDRENDISRACMEHPVVAQLLWQTVLSLYQMCYHSPIQYPIVAVTMP